MGYYIETAFPTAKAMQIIADHSGRVIEKPSSFHAIPDDQLLICVVENGFFDAAAVCYNESEFEEFGYHNDPRTKTWVLLKRETVLKLVPALADKHGPFPGEGVLAE